jgi:TonB family protein
VVRKYPHLTRPYLELLLEVGGKLPRAQALVAMLSEPEETLERRIRIMTMPFPKKPWIRGLLLATVGGLFVALACWAPGPSEVGEPEPEIEAVELPPPADVAGDPTKVSAAPTFTPYTVRPDIKNRAEIARALEAEYPPLLRDAGIGGTVMVWFFVDESGKVARLQVNESSGHKALDDAALRVGSAIEFTPALNEGKAVPVWISLPITFATDGPAEKAAAEVSEVRVPIVPRGIPAEDLKVLPRTAEELVELPPPPKDVTKRDIQAAPTFTPYTVRPDIRNRADVARALEEGYPPLLRDAGIGGTTQVWFFIDENGVVQRTMVNESSGHKALDDAALEVAKKIQFTAALNKGEPVPVWISLPITFTVR